MMSRDVPRPKSVIDSVKERELHVCDDVTRCASAQICRKSAVIFLNKEKARPTNIEKFAWFCLDFYDGIIDIILYPQSQFE